MKNISFLSKAALYKVRIVRKDRTLFNQFIQSDQWELIEEAMEKDLLKAAPIRLAHPKDSDRDYKRRYILCPANGNALLVVGEMRDKMDFSYVFVTLHSLKYKEPYVVIERYAHIFRNPDTLAEIVARALTWALRDIGVEVVLERWNTEGKVVPYLKDFWESYNLELYKSEGKFLVKMGYEDALEQHQKKEAKENGKELKSKVFKDSVLKGDKDVLVSLIYNLIKDEKRAQFIVRPIAFLVDHGIIERPTFAAFINQFPDMKGLLCRQSFDRLITHSLYYYGSDLKYKQLSKTFEAYM